MKKSNQSKWEKFEFDERIQTRNYERMCCLWRLIKNAGVFFPAAETFLFMMMMMMLVFVFVVKDEEEKEHEGESGF